MDTTELLTQLRLRLGEYKVIRDHFKKKLEKELPDFKNSRYLRVLTKLQALDKSIAKLENSIKILQRQRRREIFVNFTSRVKLVSIDFNVTLWVDAKNLRNLIGKRVGEIVELYNAAYRVEGIY
ncbi:hypothetical protein JW978_02340 [Candidatus Dojkabacteria bacterium]|nr:hypothetical protein [Candidatus Dojkabacteria bacterium]